MKKMVVVAVMLMFLVGCAGLIALNKEKPGYLQAEKQCLALAEEKVPTHWYDGAGNAIAAANKQNKIFNECMTEKGFAK